MIPAKVKFGWGSFYWECGRCGQLNNAHLEKGEDIQNLILQTKPTIRTCRQLYCTHKRKLIFDPTPLVTDRNYEFRRLRFNRLQREWREYCLTQPKVKPKKEKVIIVAQGEIIGTGKTRNGKLVSHNVDVKVESIGLLGLLKQKREKDERVRTTRSTKRIKKRKR